ncbi:MAG: hypothetical protein ACIAQZ_04625 [Sedimentisphaeraceae bacterium JB056]
MKNQNRKNVVFTFSIMLLIGVLLPSIGESSQGKVYDPPFNVLYSNDTTNILTCESYFHKAGEPINMGMLDAVVDETAGTGIDVHMLQPGFTWVPFWQSNVLPVEEHVKWWNETYPGVGVSGYLQMVLEGNDFVESFVDRCKKDELTPFISIRLNDKHLLNEIDAPEHEGRSVHISKFYCDHLDYRIGEDKNDQYQRVHNWAIPEAREYKFKFIKEICENYDISGLELDFMRHPNFFRLYETTSEQRAKIMADFVRDVRNLLDRTAKKDTHRWLSVRIPAYIACHDPLGINLKEFEKAGVDIFNISAYFFTDQQSDIKRIAEIIPDSAKYLEMTQCSAIGKTVAKGIDNFEFRRTTDEQFYTTAHLAYSFGFKGVSVFNFAYYRKHGDGDRGVFNEPPFHVFNNIADRDWVAKQKQHYFVGKIWNHPRKPYLALPQRLEKGNHYICLQLNMVPPAGGWKKDARMRLQADKAWSGQKIIMRFNNTNLRTNKLIEEPYSIPYESGIGKAEQYRGYTIPKEILADGTNQIEFKLADGEPFNLIYLDIAAE